jgi:predicted aminopeptidase
MLVSWKNFTHEKFKSNKFAQSSVAESMKPIRHRKMIGLGLMLVLVIVVVINRQLVGYALGQAFGQLRIVVGATPVEQVLEDETIAESIKDRIRLVQDIRRFAFDSLGIEPNRNYTTFYDQEGQDLMWVVTACQPFALEAHTWDFPIIGSFGYKGFFDSLKAVREEASLRKLGLDTSIRPVGGWSTLGYFVDPILSKMLQRDEGELAELIIHELTHGTVYVKDSTTFNENLATFIGVKGAELYLAARHGEETEALQVYRRRREDRGRIEKHVLRGSIYLDSLYNSMDSALAPDRKNLIKERALTHIVRTADTILLESGKSFAEYLQVRKPNNTYFMSYLRYRGYLDALESEYKSKYGGDLRRMLANYRRRFPSI